MIMTMMIGSELYRGILGLWMMRVPKMWLIQHDWGRSLDTVWMALTEESDVTTESPSSISRCLILSCRVCGLFFSCILFLSCYCGTLAVYSGSICDRSACSHYTYLESHDEEVSFFYFRHWIGLDWIEEMMMMEIFTKHLWFHWPCGFGCDR